MTRSQAFLHADTAPPPPLPLRGNLVRDNAAVPATTAAAHTMSSSKSAGAAVDTNVCPSPVCQALNSRVRLPSAIRSVNHQQFTTGGKYPVIESKTTDTVSSNRRGASSVGRRENSHVVTKSSSSASQQFPTSPNRRLSRNLTTFATVKRRPLMRTRQPDGECSGDTTIEGINQVDPQQTSAHVHESTVAKPARENNEELTQSTTTGNAAASGSTANLPVVNRAFTLRCNPNVSHDDLQNRRLQRYHTSVHPGRRKRRLLLSGYRVRRVMAPLVCRPSASSLVPSRRLPTAPFQTAAKYTRTSILRSPKSPKPSSYSASLCGGSWCVGGWMLVVVVSVLCVMALAAYLSVITRTDGNFYVHKYEVKLRVYDEPFFSNNSTRVKSIMNARRKRFYENQLMEVFSGSVLSPALIALNVDVFSSKSPTSVTADITLDSQQLPSELEDTEYVIRTELYGASADLELRTLNRIKVVMDSIIVHRLNRPVVLTNIFHPEETTDLTNNGKEDQHLDKDMPLEATFFSHNVDLTSQEPSWITDSVEEAADNDRALPDVRLGSFIAALDRSHYIQETSANSINSIEQLKRTGGFISELTSHLSGEKTDNSSLDLAYPKENFPGNGPFQNYSRASSDTVTTSHIVSSSGNDLKEHPSSSLNYNNVFQSDELNSSGLLDLHHTTSNDPSLALQYDHSPWKPFTPFYATPTRNTGNFDGYVERNRLSEGIFISRIGTVDDGRKLVNVSEKKMIQFEDNATFDRSVTNNLRNESISKKNHAENSPKRYDYKLFRNVKNESIQSKSEPLPERDLIDTSGSLDYKFSDNKFHLDGSSRHDATSENENIESLVENKMMIIPFSISQNNSNHSVDWKNWTKLSHNDNVDLMKSVVSPLNKTHTIAVNNDPLNLDGQSTAKVVGRISDAKKLRKHEEEMISTLVKSNLTHDNMPTYIESNPQQYLNNNTVTSNINKDPRNSTFIKQSVNTMLDEDTSSYSGAKSAAAKLSTSSNAVGLGGNEISNRINNPTRTKIQKGGHTFHLKNKSESVSYYDTELFIENSDFANILNVLSTKKPLAINQNIEPIFSDEWKHLNSKNKYVNNVDANHKLNSNISLNSSRVKLVDNNPRERLKRSSRLIQCGNCTKSIRSNDKQIPSGGSSPQVVVSRENSSTRKLIDANNITKYFGAKLNFGAYSLAQTLVNKGFKMDKPISRLRMLQSQSQINTSTVGAPQDDTPALKHDESLAIQLASDSRRQVQPLLELSLDSVNATNVQTEYNDSGISDISKERVIGSSSNKTVQHYVEKKGHIPSLVGPTNVPTPSPVRTSLFKNFRELLSSGRSILSSTRIKLLEPCVRSQGAHQKRNCRMYTIFDSSKLRLAPINIIRVKKLRSMHKPRTTISRRMLDTSKTGRRTSNSSTPVDFASVRQASTSMSSHVSRSEHISVHVQVPSASTSQHQDYEDVTLPAMEPSLSLAVMLKNLILSSECARDGANSSDRCAEQWRRRCESSLSRCDLVSDCPDGSDEFNCTCANYLRSQARLDKLCDGVLDCADMSDEWNCDWCAPGQFVCADSKRCIDANAICDGYIDCPSGDDEQRCVALSSNGRHVSHTYQSAGVVMARQRGEWRPICVHQIDNIDEELAGTARTRLANSVCKILSYHLAENVVRVRSSAAKHGRHFNFAALPSSSDERLNLRNDSCHYGNWLHIECGSLRCGTSTKGRNSPAQARVVGGSSAVAGEWPWNAAMFRDGEYQCGAALVSATWLLSAAHCYASHLKFHWVAALGSFRRGTTWSSRGEQLVTVAHIVVHPGYEKIGYMHDIALLRLKRPARMSDLVRPICLPPSGSRVYTGRMCTVIGWGQLFESGHVFPETLQAAQLPLISSEDCRRRTGHVPFYRVTDNMVCAGRQNGGRDACLGDSGGPLMCQESDGRWTITGIISNGYGCARARLPGVYTRVDSYLPWITSVMQRQNIPPLKSNCSGVRCPLGQCLPMRHVCDGILHCADGSDERGCYLPS